MESNFIHEIIEKDNSDGTYGGRVHTRFPPEPNGYLHIGHAKAICLDFGTAAKYNGRCNLRLDDTNPIKEDTEYVDAIMEDIRWLGFDWEDRLFYASDYFEELYGYAERLIEKGLAYVCDLSPEQVREYRGTLTEPGKNSPYRDRSIEENLDLFRRMRAGEFENGSRILRAKIDMSSPNMIMRDPAVYRIAKTHHHRTGDKWCIYPMYDYAHPLSDAIEGITHSICTLEFEIHRPLYNWFLEKLDFPTPPKQMEFARLEITDTVMSKRLLKALVDDGSVDGWDDPRMPTICGLRRRGVTPEAIRDFCERVGVAKTNSVVDSALLDYCVREDLKLKCERIMAVIDPVRVVITNYPQGAEESVILENNQEMPEMGSREVLFTRELYIEREDFMEEPPKKFFRMYPGNEVRLKGAYIVRCESFDKDEKGNIKTIYCSYDPSSKSGECERRVKGTLHWVSARYGIPCVTRSFAPIYIKGENGDNIINPDSVRSFDSVVEPYVSSGSVFQFIRQGFYKRDAKLSDGGKPVFNCTVSLKSSYRPE